MHGHFRVTAEVVQEGRLACGYGKLEKEEGGGSRSHYSHTCSHIALHGDGEGVFGVGPGGTNWRTGEYDILTL